MLDRLFTASPLFRWRVFALFLALTVLGIWVAAEVLAAKPVHPGQMRGWVSRWNPVFSGGLPVEGAGCPGVYRDVEGVPEYRNHGDVRQFYVTRTATYTIEISDIVPMDDEPVPPQPYVMLYTDEVTLSDTAANCVFAGRDEVFSAEPLLLEADTAYFLVVSHELDTPERSFRYRATITRTDGEAGAVCFAPVGVCDPEPPAP